MAPSPRKRAASAFAQTWHETDASSFDPSLLPVSKAPRAWERKAETTMSRDGKEKKVWRRYTTRSKAAQEEQEKEEQDSRFRPVKKQQRVGPQDMEQLVGLPKARKRAFKATRWDRRKSVLPRKKTCLRDTNDENAEDPGDANIIDESTLDALDASTDSVSEWEVNNQQDTIPAVASIVDADRRRSTFTFTVQATQDDNLEQETTESTDSQKEDVSRTAEADAEEVITPLAAASLPDDDTVTTQIEQITTDDVKNMSHSPINNETETLDIITLITTRDEDAMISDSRETNGTVEVAQDTKEHDFEMNTEDKAMDAAYPDLAEPLEEICADRITEDVEQPLERDPSSRILNDSAIEPGQLEEDSTEDAEHMAEGKEASAMLDGNTAESEQPEDTEISDFSIDLSSFSPQKREIADIPEAEEITELTQEDFTEASLQLDIQHDMNVSGQIVETDASDELQKLEVDTMEDVVTQESESESMKDTIDADDEEHESIQLGLQVTTTEDATVYESAAVEDIIEQNEEEVNTMSQDVTPEPVVHHDLSNLANELQGMEVALIEDVIVQDMGNDEDSSKSVEEENSSKPTEEENGSILEEAPSESSVVTSFSSGLDIADGLRLTPSLPASTAASRRKLRSPSPPQRIESGPDDVTTTMYLDDDTALLKDFLTRAAANKASKAAIITRRESLQNRRDSDAVRHALASPRKILEDKDPNSPSKYENDATLDLSQTLTLNMVPPPLSPAPGLASAGDAQEGKESKNSRRSTRTRKSRLPAPGSISQPVQTPKNISVRRADGGEPIVLKKTEAQELALVTRTNTKKNKQGAVGVQLRLAKLNTEAILSSGQDETTTSEEANKSGKRNVRWDETLAYYQEGTETMAYAVAERESLSTPDELSVTISTPSSKKKPAKDNNDSNSETPRVRKVRALGAKNGTPGKGLLVPASMLPEGVLEEKEVPEKPKSLPKASKLKKMVIASGSAEAAASPRAPATHISTFDVAPVGIETAKDAKVPKERKSRLATPKRVKLPQPVSALPTVPVPVEGKENAQRSRGIGGATPKKGLKLPEVIVPPVVESGLPRRRPGRKV